jgi:hypothetical protein
MDNIIEPTMDYDFSKLYLGPPSTVTGGAYFTKIMYNNNKPLFIQTPKCLTKQGFVKSGKKVYTDLMFDNNDTVFINWIENLESRCQELIYSKSESWFENKLEKDDIESAFTSVFKIFKSGKFYLLRVNVKPNIKIYDENDKLYTIEELTADKTIISILEIQGIKFTSRNFQIEIELKQALTVSPDPFLEECFIKKPLKKQNITNPINLEQENHDIHLKENSFEKESLEDFIKETAKDLSKIATININDDNSSLITENNTKLNETIGKEYIENNDNNIPLFEIEDLTPQTLVKEKDELEEFDISQTVENDLEAITLKKPNQVYMDIYKKAREKAKEAKRQAILAYLEVKNIKKTYMINDIDESDSGSEEDLDELDSNISIEDIEEQNFI